MKAIKPNNHILQQYPDVLSIHQLASLLQINKKTAYKLVHSGKLKYFVIGRSIRVPKIYVQQYLFGIDTENAELDGGSV